MSRATGGGAREWVGWEGARNRPFTPYALPPRSLTSTTRHQARDVEAGVVRDEIGLSPNTGGGTAKPVADRAPGVSSSVILVAIARLALADADRSPARASAGVRAPCAPCIRRALA